MVFLANFSIVCGAFLFSLEYPGRILGCVGAETEGFGLGLELSTAINGDLEHSISREGRVWKTMTFCPKSFQTSYS